MIKLSYEFRLSLLHHLMQLFHSVVSGVLNNFLFVIHFWTSNLIRKSL
nr:MAG TPA: hypothetical protein [Caudoviricetes sp.]